MPEHTRVRQRRTPGSELAGLVPARLRGPAIEVGEMLQMMLTLLVSAVRHPRGYWLATRDEFYEQLRFGLAPALATVGIFCLVINSLALGLLKVLGSPERMAQFSLVVSIHETCAFLTAMVVAGVLGTSVTADLGARKIREEIDAMRVLGLDPLRLLVLPRVISLSVMTMLLAVTTVLATIGIGYLVGCVINDISPDLYWENLLRNIWAAEVFGLLLKTFLMGLVIATVHCYKGINVGGGPQDVGKAVNQAVVVAFTGVIILNLGFNAVLQAMYPELTVAR